ncbi:MAG: ABC transporter permease [Candidatus Thermoplasmatota archaeon]|nr:ABC transporter permease [Candidatus Thermoplasmatota archaeon]
MHWEDVKADALETLGEFKKHKIGLIGITLITFMIMLGLLAPYVAPGVAEDWDKGHPRWQSNPSQAPPVWVDWITRDDYARQETLQDFEHNETGPPWRETHTHTFTYDMQADVPPKEIFYEFSGESDGYDNRKIIIERPDSDELDGKDGFRQSEGNLMVLDEPRKGSEGNFSGTITTIRKMEIRDNLHEDISAYLNSQVGKENFSDPGERNINPVKTIFGKANEKWLSDPEPLKGKYNITIEIEADNLGGGEGLDEATVEIGGAVYGIFGTDRDRRDIFLGWIWGARFGLYAGGIVALTTIFFSTSYGMTSAYYGGWVDELMSRIHEIIMGIPTLPILIIVLEFYSRSINMFVLIYALLMWRGAARVIRARGLQVAQDTYIEAAESLGSGSGRIIFRHMIPQILPYAVAQAALLVPIVIMAEAGLHILGLGDPSIVTWGTILTEARAAKATMNYQESWFWILFPGLGMVLIGFGFISTGMAVERIINPEMQQR